MKTFENLIDNELLTMAEFEQLNDSSFPDENGGYRTVTKYTFPVGSHVMQKVNRAGEAVGEPKTVFFFLMIASKQELDKNQVSRILGWCEAQLSEFEKSFK